MQHSKKDILVGSRDKAALLINELASDHVDFTVTYKEKIVVVKAKVSENRSLELRNRYDHRYIRTFIGGVELPTDSAILHREKALRYLSLYHETFSRYWHELIFVDKLALEKIILFDEGNITEKYLFPTGQCYQLAVAVNKVAQGFLAAKDIGMNIDHLQEIDIDSIHVPDYVLI